MKNEELEARALVMSFHLIVKDFELAKKCALLSVEKTLSLMIDTFKWDKNHNGNISYWEAVKQEIQKL